MHTARGCGEAPGTLQGAGTPSDLCTLHFVYVSEDVPLILDSVTLLRLPEWPSERLCSGFLHRRFHTKTPSPAMTSVPGLLDTFMCTKHTAVTNAERSLWPLDGQTRSIWPQTTGGLNFLKIFNGYMWCRLKAEGQEERRRCRVRLCEPKAQSA